MGGALGGFARRSGLTVGVPGLRKARGGVFCRGDKRPRRRGNDALLHRMTAGRSKESPAVRDRSHPYDRRTYDVRTYDRGQNLVLTRGEFC